MSEKELTPVQKEIDEAFKCISIVNVSGDAIDIMATARAHLRKAYELAAEKAEPPKAKEKDHG